MKVSSAGSSVGLISLLMVRMATACNLDRKTYQCTAYDHRPVPCRGVDCQNNEKWQVWLDYEQKIINLELIEHVDQSSTRVHKFVPPTA